MGKETINVKFYIHERNLVLDVEIPLSITANELIIGLDAAYDLGIDVSNAKKCHMTAENPIALLKGNRLLREYGLHNGTQIHFISYKE